MCVYTKVIFGGPFIYFVKIWLNKLLGLRCLVCDAVIVMSSAYVVICTYFGESGMSEM